jgi:hypothetical protein
MPISAASSPRPARSAGGFYSARARRRLLQRLVDLMLDADDPYARRARADAAGLQHSIG